MKKKLKWPFFAILNLTLKDCNSFSYTENVIAYKCCEYLIHSNFSLANDYFKSVLMETKQHFKHTFDYSIPA